MTIPVIEMVHEYLEQNGYDGLYNEIGVCGCGKDELSPDYCLCEDCAAGWKWVDMDAAQEAGLEVEPEWTEMYANVHPPTNKG